MSIPNERFREGSVYFIYEYEKVMFFYNSYEKKCFRKFVGDQNESEVPNDNELLSAAIRGGKEITKDQYEGIKDGKNPNKS